ncbi:uncharacterized protein LOC116289336 isoform X2 [Actinia tenebrosa]|nr:uncharacterized protein LOC116289336 isoform X2 [Actinia tenebrosa]
MEKCSGALSDEWVLEEMQTPPNCITLHPAFQTVCLDRWSLRLSAGKYRTIDGRSYRQTGSEEKFMRSVAYREFIHLVYDRVGKNKIPLPTCAYHAIRSKFQPKDSDECFVEFEDEVEEMDD